MKERHRMNSAFRISQVADQEEAGIFSPPVQPSLFSLHRHIELPWFLYFLDTRNPVVFSLFMFASFYFSLVSLRLIAIPQPKTIRTKVLEFIKIKFIMRGTVLVMIGAAF
jgi:hypothetical protein